MKKITTLCLITCALTINNNSFAMLTKTSSTKQIKKTRSFHTTKPMNAWDVRAYDKAKDASAKASENNELLHKIIQQNEQNNNLLKENNELLRAVLKQNALHFSIQHNYLFKTPTVKHYIKLSALYKGLEKEYNLKINPNE